MKVQAGPEGRRDDHRCRRGSPIDRGCVAAAGEYLKESLVAIISLAPLIGGRHCVHKIQHIVRGTKCSRVADGDSVRDGTNLTQSRGF